jgi:protein-S-isoprenylcysteine O-methyltransferase Ste14
MSALKLIAGILLNLVIFGVLLFLPADTLNWSRAWIFLAVVLVSTVTSTISLTRINTGILEERFKPPIQKGQPLADKIVLTLLLASFAGVIILIPLDVFHFYLIDKPGTPTSILGLFLFVAGWSIMTLAMKENAFAAPVVKHQEERHQKVIDTGVYSVVRHPMYAGAIPFLIGMALWLESYAAALLSVMPMLLLAIRILIEEEFLKRELNGYDSYMKKVRYRLIPFLW